MGEIIAFPSTARPAASAPATPGEAQILFFLGVRYERLDEAAAAPQNRGKAAGRGPRKRKRRA
jgi:hypothetical protein